MNDLIPVITFGTLVNGFPEWYKNAYKTIKEQFDQLTDEQRKSIGISYTIEDFALDVFANLNGMDPTEPEPVELVNA
jgi:hypothetical protein